jgi:hypothetical protein
MSSFIQNPIVDASENIDTTEVRCRLYTPKLPSFTPIVYNLSQTTSDAGTYALVYITGENFLPNSTTYVNFGNSFKNIPVTYYSSFNISFVVPLNAPKGNYNVYVVNVYNGNFSPPVRYTYPGNLNYSTSIEYVIT